MGGHWRVVLLGRVEARNGDMLLTRFSSQPTAALLARLALNPQRVHPREELAELLWPGAPAAVGRSRLRQALSTLKRLLEPPGGEGPPVLLVDRHCVRVNAHALGCDAVDFEVCARQQRHEQARALYGGELMPGFYLDWVHDERQRLAALHDRLLGHTGVALAAVPLPDAAAPAFAPAPLQLLPAFLSRFFGREYERAELVGAISQCRLVTLTGFGGSGKTRLAVEAARGARAFDSAVFVPLAGCNTVEQAQSQLHVSLRSALAYDVIEQGLQALAERRVLLVLDNFEQLVAVGGSQWVQSLLARAAGLHLLVTSRRALGVDGERELPLPPLPLPPVDAGLEEGARNPGLAMFVDRARNVRPDFQVTTRNLEILVLLCRALEGVPLAIELAAARCRAFTLAELLDGLARPLTVLERTRRGAPRPSRHDSLRSALVWSWQLLDAPQQQFLAALSVFRGGFSVADAQAVCGHLPARDLLESLLADSLLSAGPAAGGAMRFEMLELIRDFLVDQIEPADALALRQQHRAHFLALALALQASGDVVVKPDDLPNVQQAIRSALEDGQPEVALMLGVALRGHWTAQGSHPEMRQLLCRAAASAHPDAVSLPPACNMLAHLLLAAGNLPAARDMAERALTLACDQPLARAAALCTWAHVQVCGAGPHDELASRLTEAARLAGNQPELRAEASTLQGRLALEVERDPVAAEALFKSAEALWSAAGRPREVRLLRHERVLTRLGAGRLAEAWTEAVRFGRECEAVGERAHSVAAMYLQGVVLSRQRSWEAALKAFADCALAALQDHLHYWHIFATWQLPRVLAHLRRAPDAARMMAFGVRYRTQYLAALNADDRHYVRCVRRLVQAQIGAALTDAAWAEGSMLTLVQAVALAQRSHLAVTRGGSDSRP